jgi:hypothetical protein
MAEPIRTAIFPLTPNLAAPPKLAGAASNFRPPQTRNVAHHVVRRRPDESNGTETPRLEGLL